MKKHDGEIQQLRATIEELIFKRMVRGPNRWCESRDLHLLRAGYPFPEEFPDLAIVAVASKMRVLNWELAAEGGLQIHNRAAQLRVLRGSTRWIGRRLTS